MGIKMKKHIIEILNATYKTDDLEYTDKLIDIANMFKMDFLDVFEIYEESDNQFLIYDCHLDLLIDTLEEDWGCKYIDIDGSVLDKNSDYCAMIDGEIVGLTYEQLKYHMIIQIHFGDYDGRYSEDIPYYIKKQIDTLQKKIDELNKQLNSIL
jgi:hypothetical protein